jgi:hypothetical protein
VSHSPRAASHIAIWAFGAASALGATAAASALGGFMSTSTIASPPLTISQIDCPSEFQNFRNAVTWYDGKNRVAIEAQSGCGDKLGNSYELHEVNLLLSIGGTTTRLHAALGTYVPRSGRILLEDARSLPGTPCLGDPTVLSLDLRTGELRMPGARLELSTAQALACRSARESHERIGRLKKL